METCPTREEWRRFLDDDIEAGRRHAMESHLAGCLRCQDVLEDLTRERAEGLTAELEGLHLPHEAPRPETTVSHPSGAAIYDDSTVTAPPGLDAASPGEAPEPVPEMIGRYKVDQWLGRGGEATVYRVRHPTLPGDLVLKLAHQPLADDAGLRHRLVEEGRLLAGLVHPNLVPVVDLDVSDDGRPFLVMRYVPGRTLEHLAEHDRIDPRRAAALVASLARAAAHLHDRAIVHHDVTPLNALVDESGVPRLIDLGMARLHDPWGEGRRRRIGGTPGYLAPEQARAMLQREGGPPEKPLGPPCDVFALGAVLYFLLTGRAPFGGGDTVTRLMRAGLCEFDAAALKKAGVPRRLERIVLRAMDADPARRPTAHDLAAALERFAARRRLLPLAVLGLALLAGSVLAWIVWPGRPPVPPIFATPPTGKVFDARPLTGKVTMQLSDEKNPHRSAPNVEDLGDRTLAVGDQLLFDAEVNRPAYLYVIWIDTEGKPYPLYPWVGGDWGRRLAPEKPTTHLILPVSEGDLLEVTKGPAGKDTIMMLARETPLPAGVDLPALLAGLPRPKPGEGRTLYRIEDWRVIDPPGPSTRGAPAVVPPSSPLRRLGPELKKSLGSHFTMMRGYIFEDKGTP